MQAVDVISKVLERIEQKKKQRSFTRFGNLYGDFHHDERQENWIVCFTDARTLNGFLDCRVFDDEHISGFVFVCFCLSNRMLSRLEMDTSRI